MVVFRSCRCEARAVYAGTVIANHLYNADDEFDDIIVELPPPWDSWLDIVVTGYPDGRDPESLPRVP
ncbi:TPA: hypothetical protein L4J47_003889 [Enterobacter kobei]|nr:hypothetical protein [Enterobacter kobei]HBO1177447.1 hypothetical protein [Enterobacter kobei]HBO1181194.1 hypothetical protein [Enterobacter kobei]HBO2008929.1 hypothetical protein [Enterobacter kobei]HBO2417703.1 hypothetical protein [Enterobacter kobei]